MTAPKISLPEPPKYIPPPSPAEQGARSVAVPGQKTKKKSILTSGAADALIGSLMIPSPGAVGGLNVGGLSV